MAPEVLIPTVGFPPGAVPNGLAIGPDGNLLISTGGGIILRFAPDGTRLMPDFANGLGNGKFKIEVAPDAGAFKAYVADRNGAELLRFNFEPDGTGIKRWLRIRVPSRATPPAQFNLGFMYNNGPAERQRPEPASSSCSRTALRSPPSSSHHA